MESVESLKAAGFTDDEIRGQYAPMLKDAGFGDQEVTAHLAGGKSEVPSLLAAPPEPSLSETWKRGELYGKAWEPITGLFAEDPKKLAAKASNAIVYSEALGISPSEAFDNHDAISKAIGGKQEPGIQEVMQVGMIFPITAALMSNPIGAVLGLAAFQGLNEAESFAVSLAKGDKYQVFKNRGISALLPEEVSQTTKDVVDTLDLVAKGVLSVGIFKASPRIAEAMTKRVIVENGLPEKIYINASDLYKEMQTGGVLPAYQMEVVKSLGMPGPEWRQAVTKGLNIEIPAESIVTKVDRPWYAAVKRLFKLDPAQEIKAEGGGAPTYKFGEGEGKVAPTPTMKGTLPAEVGQPTVESTPAEAKGQVRLRTETAFTRELLEETPAIEEKGIKPSIAALEEFKQKMEGVPTGEVAPTKQKSEVLSFIRKSGGINPAQAQGEMERFTYKEVMTTRLANSKGLPPDTMRERLEEAGYLDEGSTINDMYDLMDLELHREKFGTDISTIPIGEIMSDNLFLESSILEAEKAIKKAFATGLREGAEKAEAHKKELEARAKAKKEARGFIEKMAQVIMKPAGKAYDFYYREAIENLQAGIDPSFRAKKTIEQRERTRTFLESNPEKLKDMPVRLLKRINQKALNEYTAGELEEIAVETIRLRRLGRLKRDLDKAQEKRKFEGEVDQIVFNVLKGEEGGAPPGPITSITAKEATFKRTRTIARAVTLRPSRIFDKLDGGKSFKGETHQIFYDRVNDAVDIELKKIDERLARGEEKLKELGISLWDLAEIREVGKWKGTLQEMVGIYAGIKNPRHHLAIIYGNNVDPGTIDQIVANLSPQEKALGDFVIEELADNRGRLEDAYIQYADEPLGYEENYTPMKRRDISYDSLQAEIADEFLHRAYLKKGYVGKSFSIARKDIPEKYQKPVDLNVWSIWLEHVAKQEHFINLGKITKELHRIVGSEKFQVAVRQKFGDDYVKVIDNYVSRVANPSVYKTFDSIHMWASALRQNVAVAYLAFNPTPILNQTVGIFMSLADAGPAELISSALSYLAHPIDSTNFVKNASEQMKHRMIEREMIEIDSLLGKSKLEQARKKLAKAGFLGIKMMDRVTITIGWKAVYNRALADGYSEDEAGNLADKSILRSQEAGHPKDLPQLYATSEFVNWFTIFTQQLNQIYNIATYDIPSDFKQGKYNHAIMATFGLLFSAIAIWMITNRRIPESPEDFKDAVSDQALSAIPLAGSQISSAAQGYRGSDVPMMKGAEAIGTTLGGAKWETKAMAILEGLAVSLGLPWTGPKRVIKTIITGSPEELVGGKPKEKKGERRF